MPGGAVAKGWQRDGLGSVQTEDGRARVHNQFSRGRIGKVPAQALSDNLERALRGVIAVAAEVVQLDQPSRGTAESSVFSKKRHKLGGAALGIEDLVSVLRAAVKSRRNGPYPQARATPSFDSA